jgi:HK97 family phage major capsid protein
MTIQAQREKIEHLAKQAKNMLADKGDQKWSPEDQAKYNEFMDGIEACRAAIKREEQLREAEADAFFENAAKDVTKGRKPEDVVEINAMQAVALYLRNGHNVSAEQAIAIRNAMSTTTTTEGGYTVPSEVASMVIDSMKAFGAMRAVADVFSTDGGNAMNWPTSDGTSEVGEIVAENAAASGADITFGTVAVNPYKYSSKKIALPWELIADSAIDVVGFVTNRLGTRLGRITNTHYTTGDGSSKPYGVAARASSGKTGTTGQTLTVIYNDLVDLVHAVNRAYRTGAKFMMNDASVGIIQKLVDGNSRPIWTPSDNAGISNGVSGKLLGYDVVTNDDVAVMAANAKSILFGDFSYFKIRDVAGSVMMRRFDDSAFALNGQVGFCGWMRTGSNLVDTAAVKYYANSAT